MSATINVNDYLSTDAFTQSGAVELMNAVQSGLLSPKNNTGGRESYDTQVGKFLKGGRNKNLMSGANKIVNGMEDPSFLAFSFGIATTDEGGLFGKDIGGTEKGMNTLLALNKDRSYSALTYLHNATSKNEQDTSRTFSKEYVEMTRFVNGFLSIANDHPYVFQAIDGLPDAYKLYMNIHKDSILGGGKETKIKVTCLESMDLRMSALFDSYFQSVYNHKYRRMNIPNNLLRFDCWVLLHDLRNVAQDLGGLGVIRKNTPEITSAVVNHLSTVLFLFKNCTLNVEEVGSSFDSITNKDTNETKFTFSFTYGDLDVKINSLADAFEDNKLETAPDNHYASGIDIVTLNKDALVGHKVKTSFGDDGYDSGIELGSLVKKIGSRIFNYATSGTPMGNVYDESWAGILSNMISTITNASTSSILNSAFETGRHHAYNAVANAINPKNPMGEPQYDHTGSNVYGRGSNDEEHIPVTDLGTSYQEEPQAEELVAVNVYPSGQPAPTQPSGNIYSQQPTAPTQPSGNIYTNVPSSTHLTVMSVYTDEPQQTQMTGGNIYGDVQEPTPYYGEDADLSSNDYHENIGHESLDFFEVEPNQMDIENVYDLSETETAGILFGNVYSSPKKKSKPNFHINVYDRIVESITNPIPIEKIFDTPREPKAMQKEIVFPLIRTSAPNVKSENAYSDKKDKPTKLKPNNVYDN